MEFKNEIILDILNDLENLANPDYIEFSKRMIPTSLKIIGVSLPNTRKVLKSSYVKIKDYEFSKYTNILEFIYISNELIAKNKEFRNKLLPQDILNLLFGLDNWASVDSFSQHVYGPAWINNQISNSDIINLSNSDNVWYRRLAIVSTVQLNQKSKSEEWKKDFTLNLCKTHINDREVIIQKAISWALRILVKNHREAVSVFLNNNSEILKPFIVRELKSKLNTGKKY